MRPSPRLIAAAAGSFLIGVGVIVAVAGSTLGYDYQAYAEAARRLLDGWPLYDPAVQVAGPFAIYLYPPPFAVAAIPFELAGPFGLGLWLGVLLGAFLLGVYLLPVSASTRWAIVLLAGIDWPFLYSIKLGQVGPLLFLLFAMGWRWLSRPGVLGASVAAGTLIKVQPALLLAWALATGRRRAAVLGGLGVVVALGLSVALLGPATMSDYVALLRRVSGSVTTPHNFAPGAIAYQLGADETASSAVQALVLAAVLALTAFAWLRTDGETSYLVTVVASQLLSPLLWDHYAMLLLLPVALLLSRRQWWAAALPLAGWLPAPFVPLTFGLAMGGLLLAARPWARPADGAMPSVDQRERPAST